MRLSVLACLPESSANRLSNALVANHDLRLVHTSDNSRELWQASRHASAFDVAVLDPAATGHGRSTCLTILRRLPLVPVVLYVPVSADAMRAIVALSHRASDVVALHGFDDRPERLRQIVESAATRATAVRLVDHLHPWLEQLPPGLADAVRRAFMHPGAFESVGTLADSAGFERRTLDRWFLRAGLAPASSVLAAARALEAYDVMRLGTLSMAAAARRLDYRSAKAFVRRTKLATGITLSALRGMSDRAVIARLLGRIVRERESGAPQLLAASDAAARRIRARSATA